MKTFSLSWLRRRASPIPTRGQPGFDPSFYKATYADLAHIHSDRKLHDHYLRHGRAEGRFGSFSEMNAILTSQYGALPDDFDAEEYLALHLDLQRQGITPNQALMHYLRHGRDEGRAHARMNCDLFRALYLKGQVISDADLFESLKDARFSEGKLRTGQDVMLFKGLAGGGRWIEALNLEEFYALNAGWAGPAGTMMEAIDAMLGEGIPRLAPIAESLVFDPVFYRDYQLDLADASDEDAYRHWLFKGFEDDAPGSQSQFFGKLNIPLQAYPTAFKWERYSKSRMGRSSACSRWIALEHYILKGFAVDEDFVSGQGADVFLRALGAHFHRRNAALCVRALEAAEEIAPLGDTSTLQAGDAYFDLKQWAHALDAYERVFGKSSAAPSAYFNAARAALNLKELDRVFEILTLGKDRVAGALEWRAVVGDAIKAEFEQALLDVRDHLKLGMRTSGDEAVAEAVQRVAERYAALDPIGAPVAAPSPNRRVLILANVDLRQCTHYRVEQKQELLETLGLDYAVFRAAEAHAFISALPFASAAIFYRLPASPESIRAIEVARAMRIPTYYDIDDLLFDSAEYPEPYETYGAINQAFYQSLQLGVPLFRAAMSLCDYGIASTTALAERMKPIVRKREAFVLPNGLDSHNLPFLDRLPSRARRDDSIVIFYGSGTKAHNSDFLDLAGPGLKAIMASRKDVKLMIVGYLTLDASFDDIRGQIISVGLAHDLRSYWSLLAEADINIAPLAPGATTDAKSEIKWIEAAALGLPSVVSATHRYRETLENGVDAFVAATPDEWREALEKLIGDPSLRQRMADAARRKLQQVYTLETNARNLAHLLDAGIAAAKAEAPPRKRARILLVNLFFYPQSLGGSPRVVRDNLDCFLDGAAPDDFEYAVATTDFGGDGLKQVRVESYRGCPVFRVSPVSITNAEWRHKLPQMGEVFEEILQTWGPDLVHFHCAQRFSGSAVEACLDAGIPYVVTAHDAWWVSDWQFLTDARNRLREPGEPYPFDPPAGVSVGEALDRRRYLTGLLNQADAVLGVSRAFTKLYQAAGFKQTRAVPNGVPLLKAAARTPSPSGRVRLCHVGGMSKFKGFNLLRVALQHSEFTKLELTMVDESRYGGAEQTTCWGHTSVRIVGKTLPEDMPQFYARHDVLLAPSLWPEAFGLVSREALALGLWVVASDRGAIGEDVTPDVNGFVIDVGTHEPLRRVLARIDSEPKRFTTSPPPQKLRTASSQAADLVTIYQEILSRPRREKAASPRTVAGNPAPPSSHDLRARKRHQDSAPS